MDQQLIKKLISTTLDHKSNSGMKITDSIINETINDMRKNYESDDLDWENIKLEIQYTYSHYIESGEIILSDENTDFEPWLEADKQYGWHYWKKYHTYLKNNKGWPVKVLDSLADITYEILSLVGNPNSNKSFDRRGLVLGQVQSGKTANYTGVICRALDMGYKRIIVLAGIHNNLRSQTQARLDEEILGYRSDSIEFGYTKIGVGKIDKINGLDYGFKPLLSLTNSKHNGDFKTSHATMIGGRIDQPAILVVKKNSTVLRNVLNWLRGLDYNKITEKTLIENTPLLVIDDEADNASINTFNYKKSEKIKSVEEFTKINGLIRKILDIFDQKTYIGYTATPYANLFIDRNKVSSKVGKDLFPSDFIITLPTPSNYIGPRRIFGITNDTVDDVIEEDPIPIIKLVNDFKEIIPNKHKSNYKLPLENDIPKIPDSLKMAIDYFIIAIAIRESRDGIGKHNSMLIHITRFNNVQNQLVNGVNNYLSMIKDLVIVNDTGLVSKYFDRLKCYYDDDFYSNFEEIAKKIGNDKRLIKKEWSEIISTIQNNKIIEKLGIKLVTGQVKDKLEYHDNHSSYSIIIGGDKLSRGLTLEGLSISYFLRSTKMYDTLM